MKRLCLIAFSIVLLLSGCSGKTVVEPVTSEEEIVEETTVEVIEETEEEPLYYIDDSDITSLDSYKDTLEVMKKSIDEGKFTQEMIDSLDKDMSSIWLYGCQDEEFIKSSISEIKTYWKSKYPDSKITLSDIERDEDIYKEVHKPVSLSDAISGQLSQLEETKGEVIMSGDSFVIDSLSESAKNVTIK